MVKLAEGLGFNTDSADLQNFFKNIINSSDKELQRTLPALERRGRKLREKQRQRKSSPYANARPEAESGSSADSSPEATPRPPHNSDSSLSPPGPSGVILDTPEVLRPAPSESESPSDPENSEASDTEQYVSSEDILAESDPPAEPSDQLPEDSLLESPVLPEPPDPAMPAGGVGSTVGGCQRNLEQIIYHTNYHTSSQYSSHSDSHNFSSEPSDSHSRLSS